MFNYFFELLNCSIYNFFTKVRAKKYLFLEKLLIFNFINFFSTTLIRQLAVIKPIIDGSLCGSFFLLQLKNECIIHIKNL